MIVAAGCNDVDAELWNRHRFRAESERLYEIQPGFPRLVTSMLRGGAVPHGIHEVTYKVDLSAAEPFTCERSVMADVEERLCS